MSEQPQDPQSRRIPEARIAEFFRAACEYLTASGGAAKKSQVMDAIRPRLNLTPSELSLNASGQERWDAATAFGFIAFQKAGYLKRGGGTWRLLDAGRAAMESMTAMEMLDAAHEKYAEWDAAREEDEEEEEEEEEIGPTTLKGQGAQRVWLIGTGENADRWEQFRSKGMIAIGFTYNGEQVGELSQMTPSQITARIKVLKGKKDPKNDALACSEFGNAMSEGELVLARTGTSRILGVGRIAGPYRFDPSASDYAHSRKVDWLWTTERRMPERARLPFKTLTDMGPYPDIVDVALGTRSQAAVNYLGSLGYDGDAIDRYFAAQPAVNIGASREREATASDSPARPFSEVFESRFPSPTELDAMVIELERKRALILQGPPGTGKTYIAGQLANHFAGAPNRVMRVQFHPAYSYEDFIRGIRPSEDHFEVVDGPLIEIARRAMEHPDQKFVLLIDEFNRGNVARILGETLSLIEHDKRDKRHAVRLPLDGKPLPGGDDGHQLWLPSNLFIIATMNTADRSIALVDHALRRRFAFIDLKPAFEDPQFIPWLASALGGDAAEMDELSPARGIAERIGRTMRDLNAKIAKSAALGEGHCLGHSYFCGNSPDRELELWVRTIFKTEIKPQLREYCAEDARLGKDLLELAAAFDAR
jgi:5-methylcytosine-specific restriction enzyme B